MPNERIYSPVQDNNEKAITYKVIMQKYTKAVHDGFYYEAILIDYAVMEDRLRSSLYHLGMLNTRKSYKFDCKRCQNIIRPIVLKYLDKNDSKNLGISSINGKRKIIKSLLLWRKDGFPECNDKYRKALKRAFESYKNIDSLLDVIEQCENWCKKRNEIIHALLNKNVYEIDDSIKEIAEEGMKIGREIDKFVTSMKNKKYIRQSLELNVEKDRLSSQVQQIKK